MKTGIYPLTELDREALRDHLLSLSPEDRRSRFFSPLQDEALVKMAHTLPLQGTYGYFVAGALAAVGCVLPGGSDTVEFAVSVGPTWRGIGLGKLLLAHGLDSALAEQALELRIHHLTENVAMAAVARTVHGTRHRDGTEVRVVVDLEALRQAQAVAREVLCATEAN